MGSDGMLSILPMNQTITIYGKDGLDDWGKPIKAEPRTSKGHFRYNSTKDTVVGNNGDEVVYTANIYLPSDTEADYESEFEFSDPYGAKVSGKPIRIQLKRDIWGYPMMLRVVI